MKNHLLFFILGIFLISSCETRNEFSNKELTELLKKNNYSIIETHNESDFPKDLISSIEKATYIIDNKKIFAAIITYINPKKAISIEGVAFQLSYLKKIHYEGYASGLNGNVYLIIYSDKSENKKLVYTTFYNIILKNLK